MAPITTDGKDASAIVADHVAKFPVMMFSKSYCPFCNRLKAAFKSKRIEFQALELDTMDQLGVDIQEELLKKTGQKTVPNVFIRGNHIGGADKTTELLNAGTLFATNDKGHDFDLLVIGGGSGGLSCAKEASRWGWNVACCDFVKPSPIGTTWGLGGTCVNVGCIPKKLMHQASLLGEGIRDAKEFGWSIGDAEPKHDWSRMVESVQTHIKGLNWGYKVQLREKKVKYLNELATFTSPNTLELTNKKGEKRNVTAAHVVVAVGGRPNYPDIPGAVEHGITSDDIFSLDRNPGKTLIVGASYIALECAGFLRGFGNDVTVMVRSILLRGFDQQMAEKIGEYMSNQSGVHFVRPCVPDRVDKKEDGRLHVTGHYDDGTAFADDFDTVVFAIGRTADTEGLGLDKAGVTVAKKTKKILADEGEKSNVGHIYAIGDVLEGRPELTPVAIHAGKYLSKRLVGVSSTMTDYVHVPTTVFTPIEYGCCGLAEADAEEKFGKEKLEVYHSNFWPLEWTVAKRPENACYAKLIINKSDSDRVVGFHFLGPNAGEVTQAFAGMMRMGATIDDVHSLIGIHPTCAEVFTTLVITKSSGIDPAATGC